MMNQIEVLSKKSRETFGIAKKGHNEVLDLKEEINNLCLT